MKLQLLLTIMISYDDNNNDSNSEHRGESRYDDVGWVLRELRPVSFKFKAPE